MDQRISKLESDMVDMKTRIAVAESNIKDIRYDIQSIRDDTSWLRRAFTNAIIVSVVGGIVALFFAIVKGGL